MKFSRQKGTQDLFGHKLEIYKLIEKAIRELVVAHGYKEIKTPIFEDINIFKTGVGIETDIVAKEMFVFNDRSNRILALRPEGTAPTVRALLENALLTNHTLPIRYYYFGRMFRYEKPQDGRYREFYQFGIENFGDNSSYAQVETILLALKILKKLNINQYILKVNYLGTVETQKGYSFALKKYFVENISMLSELSKQRLLKNPLRILDSKEEEDQTIIANAPSLEKFMSNEEKTEFNDIQRLLAKYNITFEIDYKLVRGLDYYTGLVYEIIDSSNKLGAKSTIIGGGAYNNLVEKFGGLKTTAIGFGMGIERAYRLIENESELIDLNQNINILIAPLSEKVKEMAFYLTTQLNNVKNLVITTIYNNVKITNFLKIAEDRDMDYLIIIGEKDFENEQVTIRSVKLKTDKKIPINAIKQYFVDIKQKQK